MARKGAAVYLVKKLVDEILRINHDPRHLSGNISLPPSRVEDGTIREVIPDLSLQSAGDFLSLGILYSAAIG